jgi:hypothetical protein
MKSIMVTGTAGTVHALDYEYDIYGNLEYQSDTVGSWRSPNEDGHRINPFTGRIVPDPIGTRVSSVMAGVSIVLPGPKGAGVIRPVVGGAERLAKNKLVGDAARDELAKLLRTAGRDIQTEVTKQTPFGRRVIDIEVSTEGRVLGGVEVKTGGSPYHPSQRSKDEWLRQNGYPVDLVRDP